VQDVHVLARDLHGFLDIAGAQGCHERDVVAVRFVSSSMG
jgi:hypothetical protein